MYCFMYVVNPACPHPKDRTDCGWEDITEEQCTNKSCCYDDFYSNTIHCSYFTQKQQEKVSDINKLAK